MAVARAAIIGPDSDIDVAITLNEPRGDRYHALLDLSDAAYDVLLETGLRIQPLPLWLSELKRPETFANPTLIDMIRREGLRVTTNGWAFDCIGSA